MRDKNYDIIVIGAGPGGYVAAIRAAQLDARVAIVEKDKVGGVCLNRGCIPTKALIASVSALKTIRKSDALGVKIERAEIDLAKAVDRSKRVAEQLVGGVKFLLEKKGIELIKGCGVIENEGSIVVTLDDGSRKEVKAEKIIIATGSESLELPVLPFDGSKVISSTEALSLREVPESILIVGGGAIGVEFATIFRGLGSEVAVIEMLSHIIPTEDSEIAAELEKSFIGEGIKVLTNTKVERVVNEGRRVKAITRSLREGLRKSTANGEEIVVAKILVAVGRRLNSDSIGLEDAGVKTELGRILVDERMETNVPGIYAIGDVTGGMMLAHKASAEGIVAAENACGTPSVMDYSAIPSCIYTLPEVASVGMSEAKAKDEGIEVKVGKFPFYANGKAVAMGTALGFVKLVAEAEGGRILGLQVISQHATDLIAEGVMAVRHKLTLHQLGRTVHAHPTLAEAIMEAAEVAEGRAIHLP